MVRSFVSHVQAAKHGNKMKKEEENELTKSSHSVVFMCKNLESNFSFR